MFGCGMLFVFNWDLFKRQLIGLSCESGFSENREAGRPGCGAQVDFDRWAPRVWRPGELFCGSGQFNIF